MIESVQKFKYKVILIMIFLGLWSNVEAQSFIGFLTENYSGVNSVIANPANSVDSRFKADINLGGFSVFGSNDYYNWNQLDALRQWEDYDMKRASRFSPKPNNSGEANIDVMGPSFMFNINSTNAVAIITRARTLVNANGINGQGLYAILESDEDFTFGQDDFNAFSQAWAEIGVSYAKVLINEKENFLKGGVTVKYLRGLGSVYAAGRNISIDYDADGSLHSDGGTTGSLTTSGLVAIGRSDDFESDDYEYKMPRANGLGLDIGVVYEWRPRYGDYKPRKVWPHRLMYKDHNKYKLKLGLSITDIGYINYRNGMKDIFDITNTNISEEVFENEDSVYDAINNVYTLINSSRSYRAILPTALHFNVDWNINHRFYLNFNADLSFTPKDKLSVSNITDLLTVTPRYESKWFSFYTPFSFMQYGGFQLGAGFRAGPLYVGSNSLFTNLINEKSTGVNIYAGLKIPIFHGPIE